MCAMSANASMDSWARSGWAIQPSHGLGLIDAPPPRPAVEITAKVLPPQANEGDVLQISEPEEYFEFIDDLLVAQDAEFEYDTRGLEGTISYTDYRNRRLGSKP